MFQATAESERSSPLESPTHRTARPNLILVVLFTVLVSGWAGYQWMSRVDDDPTAETLATEQEIEQPHTALPRPVPGSQSRETISGGRMSLVTWTVIAEATTGTADGANVTTHADGRVAVIQPGGTLALEKTEGSFYNGDGPDVRIDGPAGHRVPYILFTRNGAEEAWRQFDINQRGFIAGGTAHDFGHHGIQQGRQIMVRNNGVSALYIDAITPLHLEPDVGVHHEPGGHKD